MEGLEVTEKHLQDTLTNKDFRIDSGFYTKEPKKSAHLTYDKIGNHLLESQYGISIEMNTECIGYPIYRMNEIHNMLCDIYVDKYADISKEEYNYFALQDRDVLFNRTNSFEWVGRTGIYYSLNGDTERTFASYLVRFIPTVETILPEYLCAYLNCKYGVWDIKRRARQSINQTNVNPEEVKEIEIPLLNMNLQNQIKDSFIMANRLRLQAQYKYEQALTYLHQILEIDTIEFDDESITNKRFSDFVKSGRLDAEYYQPQYEQIENHVTSYVGGCDIVNNLFFIKDRNYVPVDDCTYKYIELSNIGACGNITGHTEALGKELPSRARRIVQEGDIIVSSLEGSLQSCALIPKEYDGAICSTGFYVLTPRDINAETSLMLFKSKLSQALMKRVCSGSIMAAMNTTEFININLPKIDSYHQSKIQGLIQECAALRQESERLLDLTKTAVEVAIEHGEDKAMDLLNKK